MPSVRRLTAILAADVAGYSRLMGADEEGTHQRLKVHLAQLVDPKIKEHRGRTVKNTGDGLLAEFARLAVSRRWATGARSQDLPNLIIRSTRMCRSSSPRDSLVPRTLGFSRPRADR
jgi:class 3 adenylate cyclase